MLCEYLKLNVLHFPVKRLPAKTSLIMVQIKVRSGQVKYSFILIQRWG